VLLLFFVVTAVFDNDDRDVCYAVVFVFNCIDVVVFLLLVALTM